MVPQLQSEFNSVRDVADPDEASENLLGGGSSNLTTVAGVVAQEEVARLRRLIFRATKGKSYMHIESYEVDESDDEEEAECPDVRSVYIIMFLDGQQIRERIKKICDSFQGERFDIPTEQADFANSLKRFEQTIKDSQDVVDRTRSSLFKQLRDFDRIDKTEVPGFGKPYTSAIYIYKMFLAKEKAVYQQLNCVKWQESTFIGYYWAPLEDEVLIEQVLKDKYPSASITPETKYNLQRPTFIKTNQVTDIY